MAKAAKEELGAETLAALADGGYYNSNELKACEENGIVAYVPEPKRTGRVGGKGRLSHEQFTFDVENNVYRCPGGRVLTPTKGRKVNGGRIEIRYTSRKCDCDACPLRVRCLSPKTPTRTVQRWEHESVLERHRARMKNAEAQMRRRAELAEHPFGTLKCRAGYCHFLVRGFEKVRGEWSLMALCYNFSRVLNIIGLKKLIAHLMKRAANLRFLSLQGALALAIVGPRMALRAVFPRQSARAVGCLIRGACSDRFLPGLEAISGYIDPGFRWRSIRATGGFLLQRRNRIRIEAGLGEDGVGVLTQARRRPPPRAWSLRQARHHRVHGHLLQIIVFHVAHDFTRAEMRIIERVRDRIDRRNRHAPLAHMRERLFASV
jgi:hypothetical protein